MKPPRILKSALEELASNPVLALLSLGTTIATAISLVEFIQPKYRLHAIAIACGIGLLLIYLVYLNSRMLLKAITEAPGIEARVFVGPEVIRMRKIDSEWSSLNYLWVGALLPNLSSAKAELRAPIGISLTLVGDASWELINDNAANGQLWVRQLENVSGYLYLGMFAGRSQNAPSARSTGRITINGTDKDHLAVACSSPQISFLEQP